MRRVTAILSVTAIVLMAAGLGAQAKPSFAGEWKMAVGALVGPEGDLIITQNATTMTLEGGDETPAPGKRTYKLDGSLSKNMMSARSGGAPAEQVSKATWAGNNMVVTTTTGAREEKLTFSMDGDNLVVETSAPARTGRAANLTKVTFKRIIRGHGG
jgi:hypothetical protein